MNRRALYYSLVLHAGLFVLAGWRSPSARTHAGPSDAGAGVSFLPELPGARLLVEAFPAPEPEPEDIAPLALEPQVKPPAPEMPVSTLSVASIPREEVR